MKLMSLISIWRLWRNIRNWCILMKMVIIRSNIVFSILLNSQMQYCSSSSPMWFYLIFTRIMRTMWVYLWFLHFSLPSNWYLHFYSNRQKWTMNVSSMWSPSVFLASRYALVKINTISYMKKIVREMILSLSSCLHLSFWFCCLDLYRLIKSIPN